MARAARTLLVVVAALGALALAPSGASAAVLGTTTVDIAPSVTIGETDVIATVTITNANTLGDEEFANTLCSFDVGSPCFGAGTELVPSCGGLVMLDCDLPAMADPGVFSAPATADGRAGSACATTTFSITEDGQSGKLSLLPDEVVSIGGLGNPVSCIIDIPLTVIGMPDIDANETDGTQTFQVASSTQTDGAMVSASTGTSQTRVMASPTIETTASAGVTLGGTVTDTATVSGRVNPISGATVTFTLFGPDGIPCQPPEAYSETVPIADDGTATTTPFAPTQPGTYLWVASYSGDDNNHPVSGECGDPGETVVVSPTPPPPPPPLPPPPPPGPATPSIGVAASPGIVVGGQISATATVGGRRDPAAGTVLFSLFGPDDASCSGTPATTATAAVNAAGVATSPAFTPATPLSGVYRWIAAYSGDANNLAVTTACGAAGSTVTVSPLPPDILSAGFVDPPRVGRPTFLVIGAYDPTGPISGVQVRFGEPRGLEGISACRIPISFGITASPQLLRIPYTFNTPGRHVITIVFLTGGCDGPLRRTEQTIVVNVLGGQSTRQTYGAAPSRQIASAAAVACKNRFLTPKADAASRTKVATAILCLVNIERRKVGLKALKKSSRLGLAAIAHSKDMLKRRYFQHAGPGGPSLQARLRRVRYRGTTAAENIGYGSNFNADRMVKAWMNSPGHKANILFARARFAGQGITAAIPVNPSRPGSTYTMVFGSTSQ